MGVCEEARGSRRGTDPFFWWFRHPYFQRGSIDLCHRLTCSDHAFNKNLLSLLPTSNAVSAGEIQHIESITNVSGPAVPSWIGNDALHLCQGSSEVTMMMDCYNLRVMLDNSAMRRRDPNTMIGDQASRYFVSPPPRQQQNQASTEMMLVEEIARRPSRKSRSRWCNNLLV